MQNASTTIKKLMILLLAGAMLLSAGTSAISAEEASDKADSSASESEEDEEKPRTDAEALALAEKIAENDKMELYLNKDEKLFALVNKESGFIWWSAPINVAVSNAKAAQRSELLSGLTLTYGEPEKRKTSTEQSAKGTAVKFKNIANGVEITYTFKSSGITVPVQLTLEDEYLKAYVNCADIVEENSSNQNGKLTTALRIMGTFGAGTEDEEGYFVIPDGSGAVINFNNGKQGYNTYSGDVYGYDITQVKNTKPTTREQISLPVYGIVKGDDGMVVVADKGESVASINASVSKQRNKIDYNICNFSFKLRTDDQYYVGGESNPLTVFEQNGIRVPEIELRYYPISGDDVSYIDVANTYRNYLIKDKGVKQNENYDDIKFYLDLYGGMMQTNSVLGIPVEQKTAATTFEGAQKILEQLKTQGIDNMVVDYNTWTNAGIKNYVVDEGKPSSVLGGKSDFNTLMDYAAANNISVYPSVDNTTFVGGNGYLTFTNTAIRVSRAFARTILYDAAYGVENKFYDPQSLLSPSKFTEIYGKLGESYRENGLSTVSLGSATSSIYGDYGRQAFSRETAKEALIQSYASLNEQVGSMLADSANAYAIPYVDHITDTPLYSSQFDVFDYDIPFYQMVVNGLVSYSSTPVNAVADVDELLLKALASGCSLHYDMVYCEADDLKDTRYDKYYYANYAHWVDTAAGQYKLSTEILSRIKGKEMTSYKYIDRDHIESEFEDVKISVDFREKTIEADGKLYKLADYYQVGGAKR